VSNFTCAPVLNTNLTVKTCHQARLISLSNMEERWIGVVTVKFVFETVHRSNLKRI